MRPSRARIIAGKMKSPAEDVFTLGVFARSANKELWRVAKDMAALPNLDAQLRQLCNLAATTPDRALFTGHAPARIDARRDAVNEYFSAVLNTPMDERTALVICQFLSNDTIDPLTDNGFRDSVMLGSLNGTGPRGRSKKEGYLTKRGKNFGGWKARFFIIEDPVLKYYECPGGAHLGSIKLQNAKIGKQSQHRSSESPPGEESEDKENQYRHAFLILEPKRKDSNSLVRHVLCAESDLERDEWVHTLLQYVDCHSSEDERPKQTLSRRDSSSGRTTGLHAKQKRYTSSQRGEGSRDSTPVSRKEERAKEHLAATKNDERLKDNLDVEDGADSLRGVNYEDTVPGGAPIYGPNLGQRQTETPSPPTHSHKQISGPTNGARIQDAESWGNKSKAALDDPKPKKRSIWGFRGRTSSDLAVQQPSGSTTSLIQQPSVDRVATRAVFGAPLAEAVEYNRPVGVDVYLPAVVYRCIEYLDAKNAASEEGIFRLSGSNVVIKGLRDRFNNEGDLNFLTESQYYDVHAVASLLKLYLRELPSTVLTRELHLDFLHVLGKYPSSASRSWHRSNGNRNG
jgi:RalA-binding protein 1